MVRHKKGFEQVSRQQSSNKQDKKQRSNSKSYKGNQNKTSYQNQQYRQSVINFGKDDIQKYDQGAFEVKRKRGRPRKSTQRVETQIRFSTEGEKVPQISQSSFVKQKQIKTENQNQKQSRNKRMRLIEEKSESLNVQNQEDQIKNMNNQTIKDQQNEERKPKRGQKQICENQIKMELSDSNLQKSDNLVVENDIQFLAVEESKQQIQRFNHDESYNINLQLDDQINQEQQCFDPIQNQQKSILKQQQPNNHTFNRRGLKLQNKLLKSQLKNLKHQSQKSQFNNSIDNNSSTINQSQPFQFDNFTSTYRFLADLTCDLEDALKNNQGLQSASKQLEDASTFVSLTNLFGILSDQRCIIQNQDLILIQEILQSLLNIIQNQSIQVFLNSGQSQIIEINCNECLNQVKQRLSNLPIQIEDSKNNHQSSDSLNQEICEEQILQNEAIIQSSLQNNDKDMIQENIQPTQEFQQAQQTSQIQKQECEVNLIIMNEVALVYKQSLYDRRTGLIISPPKEMIKCQHKFQSTKRDFGDRLQQSFNQLKDIYTT